MAYTTYQEWITLSDGELYRINVKPSGCRLNIIQSSFNQLQNMQSWHNKVTVIFFELRHQQGTNKSKSPTNAHISEFMANLSRALGDYYKIKRIGYVWVRERERAKHEHYHLAIMLDGNKVNTPHITLELLHKIAKPMQLSPNMPKNPIYRLIRNNESYYQTKADIVYRLSYLAKARGKGYVCKGVNNFSTSRLRPKI